MTCECHAIYTLITAIGCREVTDYYIVLLTHAEVIKEETKI